MFNKSFLEKKFLDNLIISFIFLIWFIFLGSKTIGQPFVSDDLHLIRIYDYGHLKESWFGNWDTSGLETAAYRPVTVLLYHIQAFLFNENVIFHRFFSISLLFILLHLVLSFLKKLKLPKKQIYFILIILIFSKIFTTLISWMILSQMIFCYCIFFLIANLFQDWLRDKTKSKLLAIVLLSLLGIFAREELYHLPFFLFLIWFYHALFESNFKNFKIILLLCFSIFIFVVFHYSLRLYFVPEAPQPNLGYINVLKFFITGLSSGLPGGYKAYTVSEITLKYAWIIILFFLFIITIFKDNIKTKYYVQNLILIFIVLLMTSPSIVKWRDFGIFLPSVFSYIIISNLIFNFIYLQKFMNLKLLKVKINLLVILLTIIAVVAGFNRSNQHLLTWNSNSVYIISWDSGFLFSDRSKNVSIPKNRRILKTKELSEKNIFSHVTPNKIKKMIENKQISEKVYIPRHSPLQY